MPRNRIWAEEIEPVEHETAPVADGYEIIIHVRESALQSILQVQHSRGVLSHERTTETGSRIARLVLGSPSLALIPGEPHVPAIEATLTFKILFSAFDRESDGLISSEPLILTVHTTTQIAGGQNPSNYVPGTHLDLGWTAQESDIVTESGNAPGREAVLTTLEHLGSWQDTFRIPEVHAALPSVSRIGYRVFEQSGGERILGVGLVLSGFSPGAMNQLERPLVADNHSVLLTDEERSLLSDHWAIFFSSRFVISNIKDQLLNVFHALPPPYGAAGVPMPDHPDITLTRLEFSLVQDHVHFNGSVSASAGTADFTFDMFIGVRNNAIETIFVNFSVPNVDLDLFESLADFFSGGDVSAAVRSAMETAFRTSISSRLNGFFSTDLLSQFASGGPWASLQIEPVLSELDLVEDGMVLHGRLSIPQATARPVASLSVIEGGAPGSSAPSPAPSGLTAREEVIAAGRSLRLASQGSGDWPVTLDGSRSWTPGGNCVQYAWDFGDGMRETRSGRYARSVTRHYYAPGEYFACLRVRDEFGNSTSVCRSIRIGSLELVHLVSGMPAWEVCRSDDPICLRFLVHHYGTPVEGARVVLETETWSAEALTGPDGTAGVVVDLAHAGLLAPPPWAPSILIGSLRVSASAPEYMAVDRNLWVYDCTQTSFMPSRVDQVSRELMGLFERWQGNDPRSFLGGRGVDPQGPGSIDPVEVTRGVELVVELEMLSRLSTMISMPAAPADGPRVEMRSGAGVVRATESRARDALTGLGLGFVRRDSASFLSDH